MLFETEIPRYPELFVGVPDPGATATHAQQQWRDACAAFQNLYGIPAAGILLRRQRTARNFHFMLADHVSTSYAHHHILSSYHIFSSRSDNETMGRMHELALANRSFLFFWAGFEAAQHCVLNKLRTPLGKPQETFTTIEGALKVLAREISCGPENCASKRDKRGLDSLLHEHTRVRLLVEFLEHLERVIHNAAEGCAVALLPHSKPVRTFFHTNRSDK